MVKAIFKKEMIDILRDKKTLFMGIVLPIILYPVLMILMTQILSASMNNIERQDTNIAFNKAPSSELISIIDNYSDDDTGKINIIEAKDYKKELEDGLIDAYIEVEENNNLEDYSIYINSSKERN